MIARAVVKTFYFILWAAPVPAAQRLMLLHVRLSATNFPRDWHESCALSRFPDLM